ncbi:helix-turn-helix transcriptional regulator [Baekduia sp. Peel2402]|uniref:helix-turn-helix transcriptional regulator n=1 Tax=Baekduia sp. Peel2402 TaxID=3458296 RepID=UPI00403E9B26
MVDRDAERAALDGLLKGVRGGQSAVLVLRGEAGIGKTALLEVVAERADGCRVARVAGVQAEMELAFAGLHQLCAPMLDGIGLLPEPQQQALEVAFGMREGGAPNRFLVSLAVLGLLAMAAEARPLVCVFDDAQWLDRASAQVLAFVARRLLAEPVAMVFAVRAEPGAGDELEGLPELAIEGLADADARVLLESSVHGPVDARVRERVLAETRGNPLALLELPRGLTATELAGGFALPDARPLANRIEGTFLGRVRALPEDSQTLLLAAAAEPLGDATLLWKAAELLGIGTAAGGPAEDVGLIELGARPRFAHPLVRSAVYRAADPTARRAVHRALAEATDPGTDPDRRAWHRAHATAAPDEAVAAELARSADRAQRRSGLVAAATFLQRATELTPDPAVRVERALAAADAKLDVADAAAASELLAAAELGPVDALQRARVERLRAQIVFARRRGGNAGALLLEAARRLDGLDPVMARDTYLDAFAAAMFAGRLRADADPGERAVADASRGAAERAATSGDPADRLLVALVARFTDGYAASVAPLSEAIRASADAVDDRWRWLACRLAQDLWDDELWHRLAVGGVRVARETGALNRLPVMANYLAAYCVHSGAFTTADALVDEVDAITQATGLPPLKYASLMLMAARGDRARWQAADAWGRQNAVDRGEGSALALAGWLAAMMHNGEGRHAEALEAARDGCAHEDVMAYGWALAERIEAAVQTDHLDEAAEAHERLSARTQAAGTPWALGIEARCAALVGGDESKYMESIEHLSRSRAAVDLARARLLYGEWLRGQGRRADAREPLRTAHADLTRFGASAFAERARRELLATGETVRRPSGREPLTPQELQVAQLARDGHTNPEIGAQLFISPRTVEYHLSKVFRKLDVSTRRELRRAMTDEAA